MSSSDREMGTHDFLHHRPHFTIEEFNQRHVLGILLLNFYCPPVPHNSTHLKVGSRPGSHSHLRHAVLHLNAQFLHPPPSVHLPFQPSSPTLIAMVDHLQAVLQCGQDTGRSRAECYRLALRVNRYCYWWRNRKRQRR